MRIALLLHESDSGRPPESYRIHLLARLWAGQGHDVVPVYGAGRFVPADVAILHVDLSLVPPQYLELAAKYPLCMNLRVRDIRKSTVSRQGVRAGDGWNGPVIVKTDLNHAGVPERFHFPAWRRALQATSSCARRVLGRAGLDWPGDYRVYPSMANVPAMLVGRRGVFVERFLPEIDQGEYVARAVIFIGARHAGVLTRSASPVVRYGNATHLEPCEAHPAIVRRARDMGLDYGKIDYLLHKGQPILIDVNKTIGGVSPPDHPVLTRLYAQCAPGLEEWTRTAVVA